MADPLTLLVLTAAALASLFMAWTIGAGSSGSTPFAPAVGAGAIPTMRAGFFVGILGLLGAILQGANVTEAVGRDLIQGVSLSAAGAILALVTAAAFVALGVFRGYPVATAFTVTGAVIGAGLALGGAPAWSKYAQIGGLWVLTPFVGGGLAYIIARALRSERVRERLVVPSLGGLVGAMIANIHFTFLEHGSTVAAVVGDKLVAAPTVGHLLVTVAAAAAAAAIVAFWMRNDDALGERRFLVALGALVAFSAGGSQVGLAIGPLVPLTSSAGTASTWLLVLGGIGMLAGSWMVATRMIKAISRDYSSLGPRRSIAALIPAFAIAQTAVLYGIPVSFNEIMISAIVGSGFAAGPDAVSTPKMTRTVMVWGGSLVAALVVSYGLVWAVGLLV